MGSFILKISLAFCLALIFSCSRPIKKQQRYNEINNYFIKRQHKPLNKNVEVLFVITEQGCPGCNKSFALIFENNLHNNKVDYLITATGSVIDMKPIYKIKKQHNIFFDQTVTRTKYAKLFNRSEVYFLKNNQVDTTVVISADEIQKGQLDYISKRLAENE